ncbi:alpha-D-ribose 1-methylphosphonate 5-triphosphate diphosphatase [Pseudooceanicola nanhaiensis]|nr:alpha-D-ribose 1-methylphosphonate 5-triphosphate diphosphatase [Pseudooceanicola nanhaiensis]
MSIRIEGAQVVLPDGIEETSVTLEEGRIAEIGSDARAETVLDARGQMLAPAMIDVHGDAFERQLMPRPNVFFPVDAAILDTDRQLAGNGIATAYHALTLSWEPGLRAVTAGRRFIETLHRLAPRLIAENRVQLRWETYAEDALPLIEEMLEGPLTPSLAFNDHLSMTMRGFEVPIQERAFEFSPAFVVADPDDPRMLGRIDTKAKRSGLDQGAFLDLMKRTWATRPEIPARIAAIAETARKHGAPMLSHDDTQHETRNYFRGIGARISEFPMSVDVAKAAKAAGDLVIFGAPNVMRGGSHIGSPGAAEMVEAGLCDILASDYFYPAMLAAVARLHHEKRAPLAQLWKLVTSGPATAMGLSDRGQIAQGLRADLILVDWPEAAQGPATPAVTRMFRSGRQVYVGQSA